MPRIVMYAAATQHQQMVKCAIMDTIVGLEVNSAESVLQVFQKNRTTTEEVLLHRTTEQQDDAGRNARVPLLALLLSFCS